MNELIFILHLLGTAALVHLWIVSEPTIVLRNFIGFDPDNFHKWTAFKRELFKMITCHLCIGFWIGLGAFHFNLCYAALVAVFAALIEKYTRP